MRVLKFGGTSIGSSDRIRHVVNLISENTPKIVVFSAISGGTNLLSELIKYAKSKNNNNIESIINLLYTTHNKIITELVNDTKSLTILDNKLKYSLTLLTKLAHKANISKYENQILAQGELLSANIIFYYAITKTSDTIIIPATEYMRTNKNGEPDYKETSKRLNKNLQHFPSASLIITNGYICKNNKGKIDNLGRGGSDYSATIIGNVINADKIEIWTDIEGIHNNDPRFVKNTTTVSKMTYVEASELAFFGAKVLHPLSIIPAQIKNIPVIIKNTLKPYLPGTLITNECKNEGVKAISVKDEITTIKVKSARMVNAYGFLRKIFEIFEKYQTSIDMLTTSETSVAMTIDNTKHINAITKELKAIGGIEVVSNQAIICLVGGYENERNAILKDIIDGFGDTKIRMISYGASKVNISFTINACDKELVLNTLHNKTFKTELCSALN